jgi:hypothetical protein
MMNVAFAILSAAFIASVSFGAESRNSVMHSVKTLTHAFEHTEQVSYMVTKSNEPSAMAKEFFARTYAEYLNEFKFVFDQTTISLDANHMGFLKDGRPIYKSIMAPLNTIIDGLVTDGTLSALAADELKKTSRVAISRLRHLDVLFGYDGYTANLQSSDIETLYIFDKKAKRIYNIDMTSGWVKRAELPLSK